MEILPRGHVSQDHRALHRRRPYPAEGVLHLSGDLRPGDGADLPPPLALRRPGGPDPQSRATTFSRRWARKASSCCGTRAGAVRAYHNVCRHRGTRLCEEHTGRFSETIQCPYHAWTYSLDGRLIGAPSTNDLEGFDKAEWPLFPVATAVWEGFLFINLADEARAVRARVGPAARQVLPVQHAESQGRPDDRVRRQGQLEAPAAELLGVLPLRTGAPGARRRSRRRRAARTT